MEVAILKTDGTPVKLGDTFPSDKIFLDVDGFLVEFDFAITLIGNTSYIKYKYFQSADFKDSDRKSYTKLEGYYNEKDFLDYIRGANGLPFNKLIKFNFTPFQATVGESITVSIVDYNKPFEFYYKDILYTFDVESTGDNKGAKKYKKPVYSNTQLLGYEIDIPKDPNKVTKTEFLNSREGFPTGYFYKFNFGDQVNNLSFDDILKSRYKRIITFITFKISQIVLEIFPKLASQSQLESIDFAAESNDENLTSLDDVGKIIFSLKKSWCYYYTPNSALIHKRKPDPILYLYDYDELLKYYSQLAIFYDKIYKYKGSNIRTNLSVLFWLLQVLPQSALSLLPYEILLNQVKGFVNLEKIDEEMQRVLVRLVICISDKYGHMDDFLIFLLTTKGKIENKSITYFEALYKLLDDARLERLTIVNWFVNEQTNRKYFAYAIFRIWKISKYNWDYYPPNTPQPDLDSNYIKSSSYWLDNAEFNENNILEFVKGNSVTANYDTKEKKNVAVDFRSEINDSRINIDICKRKAESVGGKKIPAIIKPIFQPVGSFHLYQPITLLNYQGNIDLQLPKKILFPAFLIHFIREYDELADFDALISITIDLGIEVGLFFATGGTSIIQDLKYLKYTSRIGRALLGRLPATESVLVWNGLSVGGQAVTFGVAGLMHVNNYLINTENDPAIKASRERVQKVLLWSMIASAVTVGYAMYKTVNEANTALDLFVNSNSSVEVNNDTISLLTKISGEKAVVAAQYSQELGDLDLVNNGAISNVVNWYRNNNLVDDAKRLKFIENFGTRIDDLKALNAVNGRPLQNWLNLTNDGIIEATKINFVTNDDLVVAIMRYYTPIEVRSVLETFDYVSKTKLLYEFGKADAALFNKIIERPKSSLDFIKGWQSRIKVAQPDKFDLPDVINILKSDLNARCVDLLTIKNNSVLKDLISRYITEIKNETMLPEKLKALYDGSDVEFQSIFSNLTAKGKNGYKGANKLIVKTEIYDGTTSIDSFTERYLSGNQYDVRKMFNNEIIPSQLTEPNYVKFDVFNKKALDFLKPRQNDTEIKYLFNLLEHHWERGNRFVIEMESMLYTCESCRGYLVYLKDLAAKSGKTIEIKVIAHQDAPNIGELKKLIN